MDDFSDLRPDNTAILVVDMSRDFIAPGAPMECPAGRAMAARLSELLRRCRKVGLPVIYVNHVHRLGARDMGTLAKRFPKIGQGVALRAATPGVEIWDEVAPQPGDLMIEKIRQSGFAFTSLEAVLRELGIRHVVLGGVSVNACVDCTARDAVARDFHAVLLSDGTATTGLPDRGWGEIDAATVQRVFLTNFAVHLGRVASVQQLLEGPLASARVQPPEAAAAPAGRA